MSARGKLERDLARTAAFAPGRFTPAQRAELRDAAARSRIEAQQEHARLARREQERKADERAEQREAEGKPPRKRRRKPEPLRPKSEPMPSPTDEEAALADRLLPHVCLESVIDRRRHALNIARSLFALGLGTKEATDG